MEAESIAEQISQLEQLEGFMPYVALFLFIYAIYKKLQYHRLKQEHAQLQEQMDRLFLRQQAEEAQASEKAELDVQFIRHEDERHPKLQIRNLTTSLAKNIRIEFPDGNNLILQQDIEQQFPVAVLNKHKAIECAIAVYNNAPRKIKVELIWDDGFQDNNVRAFHPHY